MLYFLHNYYIIEVIKRWHVLLYESDRLVSVDLEFDPDFYLILHSTQTKNKQVAYAEGSGIPLRTLLYILEA